MKYRKKPVVIEAFRLGIDYIPDWFMDKVASNDIILHGKSSGFEHCDDTNADIKTSILPSYLFLKHNLYV